MTTLTVDLPADVYQRLQDKATRAGRPIEVLAEELLTEHVAPPKSERERAREVLRAAGLLAEPSAAMKARAAASTATLEEVSAALDRAGGRPLSEIIIEQRGPKE